MAKKKKEHKIVNEFREFISKGNVVDMAVGVIIGGAFSAIVTALTNNILKPLINWIIASIAKACGAVGGLDAAITILVPGYGADGKTIDLTKSIYIDWGAFISSIINFLLIAIILFAIVKAINTMKSGGTKLHDKKLEKYYQKHPEERPVPEETAPAAPTELELLTEIRDLLAKSNNHEVKDKIEGKIKK